MTSWSAWVASVSHGLRRIFGMPDYARYVAHMQTCHPGCRIADERAYYNDYIATKYQGGGGRCC